MYLKDLHGKKYVFDLNPDDSNEYDNNIEARLEEDINSNSPINYLK